MAVSPVLQIREIVRPARSQRRLASAISDVLLVGFVLWLAYGIASGNWALIVPNVVAVVVIARDDRRRRCATGRARSSGRRAGTRARSSGRTTCSARPTASAPRPRAAR